MSYQAYPIYNLATGKAKALLLVLFHLIILASNCYSQRLILKGVNMEAKRTNQGTFAKGNLSAKKYTQQQCHRALELYESGLSCKAVAEKLNIGKDAVYGWVAKAGIKRTMKEAARLRIHYKLPPEKRITKEQSKSYKHSVCPNCKKHFYARKRFDVEGKSRWQKYCSIKCSNIHRNKGYITKEGYVLVPIKGGRPKRRCRIVAEEKLGRPLKRSEHVHHIDFDKSNDNPKNLHVFSNNRNHQYCHASFKRLVQELFKRKIIKFENGAYRAV